MLGWRRREAPDPAIVVGPPWRKDLFYRTERAQVVNFHYVATDRLAEWWERNKRLTGPLAGRKNPSLRELAPRYDSLTLDELAAVRSRYGGDLFIARTSYPLPVLFQGGEYRVYDLRGVETSAGAAGNR